MTDLAATPPTRARRVKEHLFRAAAYVALVLVIGPSAWMVISVVAKALPHWHWSVLTTPTQGESGGLSGAILGTLLLGLGVLIMAGTVGVLAGIYLAEMRERHRVTRSFAGVLRGATEVLSGFPSIVLGYVGYVALVLGLGWGFSLLPALIILSIMVVPYIAKSTEVSLRQVPTSYREGAEALGMSMGYGLRKVVLRSALPGITTGVLIALAIAIGETAPLIYTAGWNPGSPSLHLIHSNGVGYLTYVVWAFWEQPSASAHQLSYDAAMLLVVLVLVLLVVARIIVARTQRHADTRGR